MSAANRRAANLSLDAGLLAEARAMKINLSRAAEDGIARAVAAERTRGWAQENADVIQSNVDYVEKHGLPLEKHRMF